MSKKIGTRMQPFTVTGDNLDGVLLDLKQEINDFLVEGEENADWFNFIDLRFSVLTHESYDERQYTVVAMVIYETDGALIVKKVTLPSRKADKKAKKTKKKKNAKAIIKVSKIDNDCPWDDVQD